MKRITFVYIATLLLAGSAILGVLRAGRTLAAPGGASGEVQQAATPPQGAVPALAEELGNNLDHPLSHLLVQMLVILIVARVTGKLFARLGQPAVVGEMAAGILLGPSLFGLLAPEAFGFVFPQASLGTLRLLSQIGVCFFMFSVGMEVDTRHLRSKAQVAVAVSHASILLPYLLGVILAYFLFTELAQPGTSFVTFALFMGISMSITAFPVLARILQERALSKTFLGTTAIACAAVDDVSAWSILAFVVAIATAASIAAAALKLLLVLAFVVAMVFGVRRLLPRSLGHARLTREHPTGGTLTTIVALVIASALTTEVIGIHALFGAFLAGAIMPDAHGFRRKVSLRIENFSTVLLLPLFFAFTGLRTQMGLLADARDWLLALLIIAVATAGKLGGSALAARLVGLSWRDSLQLGALMNTRGLMELIVLNIGYDLGILSPRIFTMLVLMALGTTMMTGPLLTLFRDRSARVAAQPA